jgi:hypothetical protein
LPEFRDATYSGETIAIENDLLLLEVHRRTTGWGWGEVYPKHGSTNRPFAVIEHMGEADVEGYDHPLRMEASEYEREDRMLAFDLKLNTSSCSQGGEPPLTGRLELSLSAEEPCLDYSLRVVPQTQIHLRSLRGIWLRVGAGSFGSEKHDAILPGVEWLFGDEWSSGTDFFEHPEALRVAPHPHKVGFPLIAISHRGTGLGLSWNPNQSALSHTTRIRMPQPIFASPNFIDRRSEHLMGLMYPSARWGLKENALKADPPITVLKGLSLDLDARITVVPGKSLDVVLDWIGRHGLPDPGGRRYRWKDALERIAEAYNTNLWTEGEGWGLPGKTSTRVPEAVRSYVERGGNPELLDQLRSKIEWAKDRPKGRQKTSSRRDNADELLSLQTPEGDFPYDPKDRHRTGLSERAELWRPLGQPGDSAVDLVATAAKDLILAGEELQEDRYLRAARRALDFALKFERPEGGDWWETPLRSPNLLAAGDAAVAYYMGYRVFRKEAYLERARHWIRCLLPFTHLWEPPDMAMIYNTKPCLSSTSWFLSDWTAKHVQWEVLSVFARSRELGIDWSEVDPEVDWGRYQEGVTTAVLRWMIDHEDAEWMFRSEFPSEQVEDGEWDGCFCDTFDPVSGTYGGAPIVPEAIVSNILMILGPG